VTDADRFRLARRASAPAHPQGRPANGRGPGRAVLQALDRPLVRGRLVVAPATPPAQANGPGATSPRPVVRAAPHVWDLVPPIPFSALGAPPCRPTPASMSPWTACAGPVGLSATPPSAPSMPWSGWSPLAPGGASRWRTAGASPETCAHAAVTPVGLGGGADRDPPRAGAAPSLVAPRRPMPLRGLALRGFPLSGGRAVAAGRVQRLEDEVQPLQGRPRAGCPIPARGPPQHSPRRSPKTSSLLLEA
jgi:hypothetical protein